MTGRSTLFITAAWLAIAASASAQEPVAQAQSRPVTLTVEDLVSSALAQSPELRAVRALVEAAEGQVVQAGLKPNPMLRTDYMDMVDGPGYQASVEFEWPFDLGRKGSRVAVARRSVDVTSATVRERERDLAARVREQAGLFLAARRSIEVADQVLGAARQLREQLENRVAAGAAPQIDANLATVEVWRLEADRTSSVAEADVAAIELRRLCGLPPDAPLELSDSLEAMARAALPPPALAVDQMLARRPDLVEAAARVRVAEARVTDSRSRGGTDLSMFGAFNRTRYSFMQQGFDDAGRQVPIDGIQYNATVGLAVQLPWRNRNQGEVTTARAEQLAAQAELASRELSALAELASAVARDREARRAVDLYANSIRGLAQKTTDIVRESYTLGRSPLSDLLAEQRRFLEIEADYTAALSVAYRARVALRRAQGELP
jgi:outer membrane protein, heavy metal efflux system